MSLNSQIIKAPEPIPVMDSEIRLDRYTVDYSQHFAYKDLIVSSSVKQKASSLIIFIKNFIALIFKRVINYERIPQDIREARGIRGKVTFIQRSFKNLLKRKIKQSGTEKGKEIAEILDDYGCCVIKIDDTDFDLLSNAANPHLKNLSTKRAENDSKNRDFDENRYGLSRENEGRKLFKICEQILSKTGILDAVSIYIDQKASLIDVNPQINDVTDSFWHQIFVDLKLTDIPKASYYHRDASGGDIKAIFYLTDVGKSNGPFSYVIGSHKLRISMIDNLICETIDHSLGSTDSITRTKFSALPLKLRQKGAFGNDLLDDSKLSLEIQKSSWEITGTKGSIVLFDTKGIHRGGMVKESERKVLTTVLG